MSLFFYSKIGLKLNQPEWFVFLFSAWQDYLEVIELLNEITHEVRLLQKFGNSNQQKWSERAFNDFPLIQVEEFRKTYSFCGDYIPGPLIPSPSAKYLLLAFRSDDKATSTGFQLKFQFLPRLKLFSRSEGRKYTYCQNILHFRFLLWNILLKVTKEWKLELFSKSPFNIWIWISS